MKVYSEKGRERKISPGQYIITKTDTAGTITYANSCFLKINAYTEQEVLFQPHNIVRHSDMPRAIFHHIWQKLQGNEETFAFVKNRTKDDCYYWAYAAFNPDMIGTGLATGYFSVRERPSEKAIKTIQPIYAEMMLAQKKVHSLDDQIQAGWDVLKSYIPRDMDYEDFILSLQD